MPTSSPASTAFQHCRRLLAIAGLGLATIATATPRPAEPMGRLDGAWVFQVSRSIAEREYHLSPAADGWTAPNRAHDLRATWHEGILDVEPRVDPRGWHFRYELTAVGRGTGAGVTGEGVEPPGATDVSLGRIAWSRGALRESYLNDVSGIEQVFELSERPAGPLSSPVVLEGCLAGLDAVSTPDGQLVVLSDAGGVRLQAGHLIAVDALGRLLPVRMDASGGAMRITLEDRAATYPVTIDPLLNTPATDIQGNQVNANLGISVASAGDVNGDGYGDVIVGAPLYDNGPNDEGMAFVHIGSAGGVNASPSWRAEANQGSASFGISVASAGDVNGDGYDDIIIGASRFDNGQQDEGAAFVFHGGPPSGGNPTGLGANGTPANADWMFESDQMNAEGGISVAGVGDVSGDGIPDVAIGVHHYIVNVGGSNVPAGLVVVFDGSAGGGLGPGNGTPSTADWIRAGDQDSDEYGISVAGAGNLNGDATRDLIVGAELYDNGQTNEGRVYVYSGPLVGTSAPTWQAESNQAAAQFGHSVASAGDVNCDGFDDIIVGAPLGNGRVTANPFREGAVGVWYGGLPGGPRGPSGLRGAQGTLLTADWTGESEQSQSRFGWSVSSIPDYNCNHCTEIIIGAPLYDGGGLTDNGGAFVWEGPLGADGTLSPNNSVWHVYGYGGLDQAGYSVAGLRDVNGDTLGDAIVGAPLAETPETQTNEGEAYIFLAGAVPPSPSNPDSDGDTVADSCDGCPNDRSTTQPGPCGCPSTPINCDDGVACTDDSCVPPGGCVHTANAVCNDADPCTTDTCDPMGPMPDANGCTHAFNTASCDDANACTVGDHCSGGDCIPGSGMPNCDDSNPCTTDTCMAPGGCVHAPVNCNDGNACTDDSCNTTNGMCVHAAHSCNDGNPCTDDTCDSMLGCQHSNNAAACSDGSACTTGDHCSGGSCVSTPVDCNDGNVCTTDTCNPSSGCVNTNNTVPCDDGNACTTGDACSGGSCVPGGATNCSDGNTCTDDTCVAPTGCTHPNNTAPCNDGSACTTNDTCAGGSCVGGPPTDCSDGNVCTDDPCNATSGCFHTNNTAPCSDGNACTTGDTCGGAVCHPGGPTNCDDGNPCTNDSCNPSSGCVHVNNTATCNDGNACTVGDACSMGACVGGAPLNCNDGSVCTDDTCNPMTGCVHTNNAATCTDGNPCTTGDTCSGGACQPGGPTNCDDGNVCTNDGCTPTSGCFYVNNTSTCSDGNACTTGDNCGGGVCIGGPAPNCNDGNPCTDDSCDSGTGCVHTNNTLPCNDGSACTTADTCAGGACVGGAPPNCNDGNPCTNDPCNPTSGCFHTNNTAPCNDGNACTTNDTCAAAACVGGAPPNCDDGNPCTDDGCNPMSGCTHVNNNARCDDGNPCTMADTCINGGCRAGPPVSCDDGNTCTIDSCNPASGCVYANDTGAACDDGNACTAADTCQAGFSENFDSVTPPALPPGWTTTGTGNLWITENTVRQSPPNAAMTDDPPTVSDKRLDAPAFTLGTGPALLTFSNRYNLENGFDGAVLEIKIGAGSFQDILAAGGSFVSSGYNGTIPTFYGNPLGGRLAWTGNSSGFITTRVNLPAAAAGQPVVLRWRVGTDSSVAGVGQVIDTISVTGGAQCLGSGPPPACDDGNPCTADSCDPTQGCVHVPMNCDDGVACTADSCTGGSCQHVPNNAACDDTNPCTDDSCDLMNGCVHVNNALACDDGNACTMSDTCTGGVCRGGPPVSCDDGNGCTIDTCNPATGCVYSNDAGAACNDGSACTTPDTCQAGLSQNFDGVTPPALPAGWTTSGTGMLWRTVSGVSQTPPNSAFTDDPATVSDKMLDSPAFTLGNGPAQLRFANRYDLETGFDGAVLEIKIGAAAFQDILAAGGSFVTGGYNGTIPTTFGNPLGGRMAWTGNSGSFVPTVVNLPLTAAGQSDVLRWRVGTDSTVAATGQWIDSVTVSGGAACSGPPTNCDDEDGCTTDSCNPSTGCMHVAMNCDDGVACTVDTCVGAGTCQHAPNAAACDDALPCTDDRCDAVMGCVHANNTVPCDDGNACTMNDKCSAGSCRGGPPVDCDDGNPCTDDLCDPAMGCFHVDNGNACNDGNACTSGDVCQPGFAQNFDTVVPPALPPGWMASGTGNPWVTMSLMGAPSPPNIAFTDDPASVADKKFDSPPFTLGAGPAQLQFQNRYNLENGYDGGVLEIKIGAGSFQDILAAGGSFVAGGYNGTIPTSFGNPLGGRQAWTGNSSGFHLARVNLPPAAAGQSVTLRWRVGTDSTIAGNGQGIDSIAVMGGGQCLGTGIVSCDDANPCTTDSCNPTSGCVHTNNTTSCDDGNACTTGDTCGGGTCHAGGPTNCDDGNPCTTDTCNPMSGCVHTNNAVPCNDGNACTTADTCSGGTCVGGPPPNCSDGNVCTDDPCAPTGGCFHTNNTAPCNDGNACTTGDTCGGGSCQPGGPTNCDDSNPCTTDTCNPGTGCVHTNNTATCTDGSVCTTGDTCSGGSCIGTPVNCSDGNVCTDDPCNPSTGCFHTNNTATCSDGNACTTNDPCFNGSCVPGTPTNCDDGNPCTTDSCNPSTGCVHVNNTASCNDGNACTTNDTCAGGACVGGAAPNCSDGNACTDDPCVAPTGCTHPNNTAPCSDGNACTTGDTCGGGSCQPGGPTNCNDADGCTTDSCNTMTGCVHVGAPDATPCDDGNACTSGDACSGGHCLPGGTQMIFSPATVPANPHFNDSRGVSLGLKFRSDSPVTVMGVRFYKDPADTGPHVGSLWTSTGTQLRTAPFVGETASGWQQVLFSSPMAIPAGTTFVVSNHTMTGYPQDTNYFAASGVDNPPLHALRDGVDGPNGVYRYDSPGPLFPNQGASASNYYVDVVIAAVPNCDDGNPCTNDSCDPMSGCVHAPVSNGTACSDGNACTAGEVCAAGQCSPPGRTTIFSNATTPANPHFSDSPVTLGVKFRSDVVGFVTGVRFYKAAADNGSHLGGLWTSGGALLASAPYVGETASGWQEVTFASPVAITAATTYVASNHTTTGYPQDVGFFSASGVDNPPLHALRDGVDGPNGVYAHDAPGPVFPSNGASASNYYIDVVFVPSINCDDGNPCTTDSCDPITGCTHGPAPDGTACDGGSCTCTGGHCGVALSGMIFDNATTPANPHFADGRAVTLGVKFRSDVNATVTGVRFYKDVADTGPHVGRLWTSAGVLLASAPYMSETPSGWQDVTFAMPVPISASTTYVASNHTSSGYPQDAGYFTASGHDNPPLHALRDGVDGPDGVYGYDSPGPIFPVNGAGGSNYYVDVVISYDFCP